MSTIDATLTHLSDQDREAVMRPLDLGLITRLFRYTKPYAAQRKWLVVLVIVRSIQIPALMAVITAVINGPIERGDATGLFWGVVGFFSLAFTTQLVLHFRQRLALELGESVVYDLRNDLFAHLQRLTIGFYHRTKLGRIISRMTSDVENVRIGVQEVLFVSIVQVGQMLGAALCMLWYDWMLFLIVLVLVPVLWSINRYFRSILSQAHRDVQESYSRVTATIAESVSGIRVTQAFVRQDRNAELFGELVEDHASEHRLVARIEGQFLPLLNFNSQLLFAALLLAGAFRVLNPESGTTIGDLVGFFLMANLFFTPITHLGMQYTQAMTSMAAAERVFRLLDTEPDWSDAPQAIDLPEVRGRVEFRHVGFEYDPGRPVLEDVNFVAQPGETIALVGHSGSGKTTITNLIAKFYQPSSGQLLIDGHDMCEIRTESLHRRIGIMVQESFLFSGTVLDNIRFSRPEATDAEVADAVERLGCLELLLELPRGLETDVGERGASLSLGQRQLVCFARAMVADPSILILDEATSSVDTITELQVQRALRRLIHGRTSFIVAHRLSTIRHASQILVLDRGRIVERGVHAELLRTGGVYAELYSSFTQTNHASRTRSDEHAAQAVHDN